MTELFASKNLQPLYIQVAEKIKHEIDKGTYPAGSKLPSENMGSYRSSNSLG
ncbi:GntR family transcriptional regulator [Vibrio mexicanus]|uniref:GntR family transcriptional regulator n=1 Tax=Vibrio mexicanus TaxID=1004326 RepID=UPI001EE22AC0|nr:GntR family transcriptional regulator [Vibrio mexicanus]